MINFEQYKEIVSELCKKFTTIGWHDWEVKDFYLEIKRTGLLLLKVNDNICVCKEAYKRIIGIKATYWRDRCCQSENKAFGGSSNE